MLQSPPDSHWATPDQSWVSAAWASAVPPVGSRTRPAAPAATSAPAPATERDSRWLLGASGVVGRKSATGRGVACAAAECLPMRERIPSGARQAVTGATRGVSRGPPRAYGLCSTDHRTYITRDHGHVWSA